MILQKFLSYIAFWKKPGPGKENFNLKVMHGINRISILMFLVAVIILVIRFAF